MPAIEGSVQKVNFFKSVIGHTPKGGGDGGGVESGGDTRDGVDGGGADEVKMTFPG